MDQRASTTDWFLLGSQDVYAEYLIVKVQEDLKGWEKLFASVDVESLSKRLVSHVMSLRPISSNDVDAPFDFWWSIWSDAPMFLLNDLTVQ